MIKANFNTYNNYVTDSLYQWDLNQDLVINGLNLSTAPEIHFANANMDRAIVRQSTLESGVVTVRIPNSLLQAALTIKAYIGIYEGDTFNVIETIEIPVIAKARPSDYVFEDTDGEIYSFKALENEIVNAKKEISDKCDANLVEVIATVDRAVENMETDIAETTATLSARVDNIIAHNNDTTGNTELIDIRTGADGKAYASAGDAVRAQSNNLKDELSYISEPSKNKFNVKNVIIGTNASGGFGGSTRAISEAISAGEQGSTISFNTIPSNLKCEIYGYSDANFGGAKVYTSGWVTTTENTVVITDKAYIRILFGSVNNQPLTVADFDGLEIQIEDGTKRTDYVPPIIAKDTIARDEIKGKANISDLTIINKNLETISEKTKNKFFVDSVILGTNADGNSGNTTRAISGAIERTDSCLTISVKNLPSNLKYEIDGYTDENFGGISTYTGWIVDTRTVTRVSDKKYIRILFGSVNGQPLTMQDFDGLKMQIEDGATATPYIPNYTATDYVARNSAEYPVKLKVCSYNIGMYSYGLANDTPSENAISNLKSFLCGNNFDIMGIQENRTDINETNINDSVYGYLYNSQVDTINWTCLKSQYNLRDTGTGIFTAGSRTYCYGTATIGNKDVFIMCIHFSTVWAERQSNYAELVEILAEHERFIVFGDFNAGNEQGTAEQAQLEYNTLINAGYKVANGGFLGLFETYGTGIGYQDNICVSSNIKIVNSGRIEVFDEMNSDHIPVFAEIVI